MLRIRKSVLCLGLCMALAMAGSARGEKVSGELATKIDAYLTRLEKFGFSGAILISNKGEVVLEKGYGMADRVKGIRFSENTVSSIGSVTKQFTGAAILKLEMMGKLKVQDPISKYLPGVPAEKAAITLHHLLTHTSGIGDLGEGDDSTVGRDEMVRRVLAQPLHSQPGERFRYSNEGFSLAAAIVEHVSGKSYEQFLREALFLPAGMKDTGYVLPRWSPERMAHGYNAQGRDMGTFESRNWGPNGPGWALVGNGGILSTPGDMHRWHVALLGEAVLSKEAKEKYFTPHVATNGGDHYGYGWGIMTTPRNTKVIEHNGGNGIFFTEMRRYVDEQVMFYVNTNGEVRATELGANQIPSLIFGGREVPMPPAVISLDAAALAAYEGTYRTESGETVTIGVQGQRLAASGTGAKLLASLNGLIPPEDPRFANQVTRTRAAIEASAKGDFEPLLQAFGGGASRERVLEMETNVWRQHRENNGEFRNVEIVGLLRQGPGVRVISRLNFESGSVMLMHAWGGGGINGIQMLRQIPGRTYLPQSATEFVSFNISQPQAAVLRFERDAAGNVSAVVVPADGGEIRARRN